MQAMANTHKNLLRKTGKYGKMEVSTRGCFVGYIAFLMSPHRVSYRGGEERIFP